MILKVDDDMFINIFKIIDVTLTDFLNSDNSYACYKYVNTPVIRQVSSKWYVKETEYVGETYPDYCCGSAFLVKPDSAFKIYSISSESKLFWVDDAFVTGNLRESCNQIVNDDGKNNSLQILDLTDQYDLFGGTKSVIDWCSNDSVTTPLQYSFVVLGKDNYVNTLSCAWNKTTILHSLPLN